MERRLTKYYCEVIVSFSLSKLWIKTEKDSQNRTLNSLWGTEWLKATKHRIMLKMLSSKAFGQFCSCKKVYICDKNLHHIM